MTTEREKALGAWIRATTNEPTEDLDGFRAGWDAAEKYFVVVSNRAFAAEKREAARADEMERLRTEVEAHRAAASVFSVSEKDWKALALGAERECDEARAALSVAREALEKARALAAKAMNISQNEDPNWRRDLEDTLWLLAYCPAPQPSTVEPPKTFTLVDKTPGCGDCGHSWLMHCGPCNETGCPCADFVEPTP